MDTKQDPSDFGVRQFQNILEKLSLTHNEFLLVETSNTDNAIQQTFFQDITVLEAMNRELAAEDLISQQRFNDDSRWLSEDKGKDLSPLSP